MSGTRPESAGGIAAPAAIANRSVSVRVPKRERVSSWHSSFLVA